MKEINLIGNSFDNLIKGTRYNRAPEGVDTDDDNIIDYYEAQVKTQAMYFPFGMQIPNNNLLSSSSYRFGFNGQEKDDEVHNVTGSSYTAEFWQYDSRLGRRWNLDPKPNPSVSQYATFNLNPIMFSDVLGDSVWVRSRQLNFFGGSLVGVHSFIYMKDDKTGEETWIGYHSNDNDRLVQITDNVDQTWDVNDLQEDGNMLIETPEGMTDSEFIAKIQSVNASYVQESLEYEKIPDTPTEEGNCNTSVTTILFNAGVPLSIWDDYDPDGYNPGLGVVTPWTPEQIRAVPKQQPLEEDVKQTTSEGFFNLENWIKSAYGAIDLP